MPNFNENRERKTSDYYIDVTAILDLKQILAIERATFPSPWSKANFLFEMTQNRSAYNFVIRNRKKEREIIGFTCTWILFGELKINNIAIKKEYRRLGFGKDLMEYILDFGFRRGCDCATLEVRGSNGAAIHLYKKLGFKIAGMRRGYYSNNGEDAYLMTLDMNERMKESKDYEQSQKAG